MATSPVKQRDGPSCTARLSIGFFTFLGLAALAVLGFFVLRS